MKYILKNSIFACVCCVFGFVTVESRAQENWTQFRGPNGQGISNATGLPIHWNVEENIVWKTDISGEG